MKHRLHLTLTAELYFELVDAAASAYLPAESPCTPEDFARECIEAALAARRLDRVCAMA